MPTIARISNTFFTSVLNRLGIRPPFAEGWEITNVVQPVSLVDSDITLNAVTSTQVLDAPSTNGLVAPALNQILASVTAPADGEYAVFLILAVASTASSDVALERVNAGGTTLWSQAIIVGNSFTFFIQMRVRLKAGDTLRVRKITAADGSGRYQAAIWIS
jgi:hypothetical protein